MTRFATDLAVWKAVIRRDRRYDGRFLYAATTTGIYCRPSCPTRNPDRRNTVICWTAEEAERRGYVACLRCYPKTLAPAERAVRNALDHIEAHFEQALSLETLSRVPGLSPHHLQETFKRIVGMSPKALCDAERIFRFKESLRAGHSISEACYEAGYGSSHAIYEKVRERLGITPGAYRSGAKGMRIRYAIIGSKCGTVLIAGTDKGTCAVLVGDDRNVLIRMLHGEFPNAAFCEQSSRLWTHTVLRCQCSDPFVSNLPVTMRTRIFQAKVMDQLRGRKLGRDQNESLLGS